jgi:hypothetical protein
MLPLHQQSIKSRQHEKASSSWRLNVDSWEGMVQQADPKAIPKKGRWLHAAGSNRYHNCQKYSVPSSTIVSKEEKQVTWWRESWHMPTRVLLKTPWWTGNRTECSSSNTKIIVAAMCTVTLDCASFAYLTLYCVSVWLSSDSDQLRACWEDK